ncbi:uncharacterized protein SOCEGT47_063930 [Sorangium cellulosum]|uniref:Uncharacterized protein n=1 Tax=Sorangium cellulosum TaxID=56 RepID=A0A4P2Q8J5_SORCE|nr:uncharacterized protein SOCEGT47_063930 [Sorangium cellulosum]
MMLDLPELLVPARSVNGLTAISVRLRSDLNPSTAMAEMPPSSAGHMMLDLPATLLLRACCGDYFTCHGANPADIRRSDRPARLRWAPIESIVR